MRYARRPPAAGRGDLAFSNELRLPRMITSFLMRDIQGRGPCNLQRYSANFLQRYFAIQPGAHLGTDQHAA
jgi:hypothetical protein